MKKSKLIAVVITVLAMLIILPVTASAVESNFTGWNYVQDGGYYEYYDYGNKYTDGEYWIDNNYFRFDAEGKMLSAEWYLNPETLEYYYYEAGGYRATNEILWIDGAYYSFNYDGVMADNGEFDIYDYEADRWSIVRAKAGGALYRNEWYQDAEGEWYYYGDNCYTAEGVTYVGSVPYYFGYRGRMYYDCNFSVSVGGADETIYRARENGILYCNEWYETEGGDWYYYQADCSEATGYTLVGSTYYFFSDYGWMVTDQIRYDEATGLSYYCDENGVAVKLNANGWTLVGEDYYYCVNGEAYRYTLQQVGSAYYFFESDGKMLSDDARYYYDENGNEYYIRAKKGGALYCGEWYLNNDYYYDEVAFEYYDYNCYRIATDGIVTIGDYDYYFYSGHALYDYLVKDEESGVYIAGSNCVLTKCSDGWLNFHDSWYYVLNGQLVRDEMIQIGGAKYGFNYEGEMYYNTYFDVYDEETGNWDYYLVGESGAVIETPGWATQNGWFFYVNADGTLYTGELDINGTIYQLYPEMNYATIDYMSEWDEVNGKYACYLYIVMPDGSYQKVTADGYYTTPYGKILVENGEVYQGWKQVGSDWYYYEPALCSGTYIYIYTNDGGTFYYFDDSGKMVANGWIPYGSTYMFADEYGSLANGITAIGGVYYMFDNCQLVYDSYSYEFDGIYVSDSNGIATKLEDGDGWKLANGYWYYVADGYLVDGYLDIMEGDQMVEYYFDYSTRRMMTNYYNGNCYFDENGRRYKGWKYVNNGWKYFGPYEYWYGIYYIDEHRYFFRMGYMLTNTTYFDTDEGKAYVIDAYGIVVDKYALPDGMIYQNGGACLIQNGKLYDGWYGEYYFEDGYMAIDRAIRVDDNWYYLDNHGKYVRGWYQDSDNDWVYADAYGALCYNEWLQLGGSWYYFDGCWMSKDGVYYIEKEDKYAEFDASGRFIGYVDDYEDLPTGAANTWECKNGNWYYYNATGAMVTDERLYIGNAWYRFDYEGKMYANTFDYSGYYYTASGARLEATCEWKLIDGKWLYFGANSAVDTGWINLNGVRYFIYGDYDYDEVTDEEICIFEMLTGYQLINGKVYYFDASGACQGEYVGNGWLQLNDGDFVYFDNGELLTDGIHNIDGTEYYFYYSGRMVTEGWYYVDGTDRCVVVSATGAVYGAGWHNTADGWVYVEADGNACTGGIYNIDGGIYFFDNGYWVP